MAENIKMVPLQVEGDTGGPMDWPVSEAEYNELMQAAESVFGQKPTEISFVVRFPIDSEAARRLIEFQAACRLIEFQKQLLHFRPEDRLLYFNALKKTYCMVCGGILSNNECFHCK